MQLCILPVTFYSNSVLISIKKNPRQIYIKYIPAQNIWANAAFQNKTKIRQQFRRWAKKKTVR